MNNWQIIDLFYRNAVSGDNSLRSWAWSCCRPSPQCPCWGTPSPPWSSGSVLEFFVRLCVDLWLSDALCPLSKGLQSGERGDQTFFSYTLYWKFETCIPRNKTAWPCSQFLHSYIWEWFIYSHDWFYLESLFFFLIAWENCRLNRQKWREGKELPPNRGWWDFPALPSAPVVESRIHINDQYTSFQFGKLWILHKNN